MIFVSLLMVYFDTCSIQTVFSRFFFSFFPGESVELELILRIRVKLSHPLTLMRLDFRSTRSINHFFLSHPSPSHSLTSSSYFIVVFIVRRKIVEIDTIILYKCQMQISSALCNSYIPELCWEVVHFERIILFKRLSPMIFHLA